MTCSPQAKILQTDFKERFVIINTSSFSRQKVESLIKHNLRQAPFEELMTDIFNAHIIPINKVLQLCRRLYYDYSNKIIVVNQ